MLNVPHLSGWSLCLTHVGGAGDRSCPLSNFVYTGLTARPVYKGGGTDASSKPGIPGSSTDRQSAQKLCLRQNQISHIEFPSTLGPTLKDLDLYDNLISHIKGLDALTHLTSLDLSFNKIKQIKNVNHLTELKDVYFVQNRIQKIEGLKGLRKLRNLELAANRIRVGYTPARQALDRTE